MPRFFVAKISKWSVCFLVILSTVVILKSHKNSNKIFVIVGELKISFFNSSFLFRQNQELFS